MLSANEQILAQNITQRSAEFRGLLDRLEQRDGIERGTAARLASGEETRGTLAVLFTDEPHRCPEAWDATVIFPELLKAITAPVRAWVLPPDESRTAARRFGIDKYPSILVLRDGSPAGLIEGMRGWDSFPAEFAQLIRSATLADRSLA